MTRSLKSAFSLLSCFLLFANSSWSEESIKLGAIFSLSSWGAEGGTSDLRGVLLAQEDINVNGGISGKKLEILAEDNRSDLRETVSAFHKLTGIQRVKGIIGPNWAEFSEVVAPLAKGSHIPFITPSGYKNGLFVDNPFAFTLWPPHETATKVLADHILEQKHTSLTVLLEANAYFEGIFAALEGQLRGTPSEIKNVMRFEQAQRDFRPVISKIKQSKSDGVLMLLVENLDLNIFLKQARELRLNLPLYASNGLAFDKTLRADPSSAEGVIYFDYIVPGGEAFRSKFKNKYNAEPGFASAKAYDAVFLFKRAIEECGEDPENIRNCLSKIDYSGLSGRIRFSPDGIVQETERHSILHRVRNGLFGATP